MEWTDEQKENILKYYTSIEEYERISAVRDAQKYLDETDYVVIKMQEYSLTNRELNNDYSEILERREEARNIIRKEDNNAN